MKLIVLFATVAIALGASRLHHINREKLWSNVEPFRSGMEVKFRYESQIASGIGNVEQSSLHRIFANVHVAFETDRVAVLQLRDVRFGVVNKQLEDPTKLKEFRFFDEKRMDRELMEKLEMPLKFEYVDGVIERVYFNLREITWTKNIKRGVLNMLQLNLKGRDVTYENEFRMPEYEMSTDSKMFTIPELTLEGDCQTVYAINMIDRELDEDRKIFNVTKSINFDSCKKLALIRYGPRSQKPTHESKQFEIDSREVDRSTVLRYQLIGTPERFAIGYVHLTSQYSYKVLDAEPLRTLVIGELTLEKVEKLSRKLRKVHTDNKEETIMYSMEFDDQEKRFYQYGDEEFLRDSYPFFKIQNKVEMIRSLIKKIAEHSYDKVNGITTETPLKVQELVELIRMCTTNDLHKIYEIVSDNETELNIFLDSLAISGTYNTIYFMVKKTLNSEIKPMKVVQLLQQLHSVPVPSSKQVEQLFTLCQSNVVERSVALKQACWLTSGSLIGDLCKYSVYDSEDLLEKQCPRDVKEKFLRIIVKELKRTDLQYEKIILLKALGNAAIDLSVFDLEKIIVDRRVSTIVRQQAIDSLRRLRNEMPRKIQKILLPIFKYVHEKPELRMTAFSMIMSTMPDKAILDQITYILLNERNQHVKSFVYTMMMKLSESPVFKEQELARELKSCIQLLKIDEKELKFSRYYRIPLYSNTNEEGILFNIATMFTNINMLPEHVTFSMDSYLNGLFEKNNMELSITQNDIERIYEQIYNMYITSAKTLRGNRRSKANGRELLDNIFDTLKIQSRRQYNSDDMKPFGMITLRIRDLDQAVIPLVEETMPEIIRDIIRGEKPSFSTIMKMFEGIKYRNNYVMSLHERVTKTATSVGIPIRMIHALPVVASLKTEVKARYHSEKVKLHMKMHPLVSGVHIIKMELWCPMINTGVETLRGFQFNLPIETETMFNIWNNMDEKMLFKVKLPVEKLTLFTVSTLPLTFIREFDSKIQLHGEQRVKTIVNPLMDSRIVELNSERVRTLTVNGVVHKPAELTYEQLLYIATTTENHITVDYEPLPESPKELHFILSGNLFRTVEKVTHRPRFDSFFTSKKFDSMEEEEDVDDVSMESEYVREEKLNKYLNKYEPKQVFDHIMKVEFKTVGARPEHRAVFELKGTCDNKMTYCKLLTDIRRTPLFEDEYKEWTMTGKWEILLPEFVNTIEDIETMKHNKFLLTVESEWGAERTERLFMKMQGERLVQRNWIRGEWRRELITAFLNKFDVVVDYNLEETTVKRFTKLFDYLKITNHWNMDMEKFINGRDNHVFVKTIIDPRTRQHVNVTVKTPTEFIRFTNIELPFLMKPFYLIRSDKKDLQINSMNDVYEHLSETTRDYCLVDPRRVKTFDDVVYRASLHKCYSVVAKDCSERKSFVVLIKKVDDTSALTKLKVITEDVITEVEKVERKFVFIRNNVRSETEEMFHEDSIYIRLSEGLSVTFDGIQARVKMSKFYKNSICGLCGHYDEDSENEFRMNDMTLTDDVKSFHKSYSMLEDSECVRRDADSVYEQDSLFEREDKRTIIDDDESGYESDEDIDEYHLFNRREEEDLEKDDETKPVKKTDIMEYGHKVCFSLKPIKQCPKGTVPLTTEQDKVQFTCLNRSSTMARRLFRDARTKDITSKLSTFNTSFVDTVKVHVTCTSYEY